MFSQWLLEIFRLPILRTCQSWLRFPLLEVLKLLQIMASRYNSIFVVFNRFIKVFRTTNLRSQEIKLVVLWLIHIIQLRCWYTIVKVDVRSVLLVVCYPLLKLWQDACCSADVGSCNGWTVCLRLSFLYILEVLFCYFWETHIWWYTWFSIIFYFV